MTAVAVTRNGHTYGSTLGHPPGRSPLSCQHRIWLEAYHAARDHAVAELEAATDRWWLVVPDKNIVRGDLPDGWGLLVFGKDGRLHVARSAPILTPEPIPATFRASLMRAAVKTAVRS